MLTRFLIVAFSITWLAQLPIVLLGAVMPDAFGLLCLAVGGLGPSLAALLVHGRRGWSWRAPVLWCALAALLPTLLALASTVAVGKPLAWKLPFLGAILLPPLGEELGWRGVLYPRLAERWGTIVAALATGLVWGLWHLPTAFFPDGTAAGFGLLVLGCVTASVLIAWLQERAGRGLWLPVLAHAGLNGVPLAPPVLAFRVVMIAAALVAAAALARRARRYGVGST